MGAATIFVWMIWARSP